MGRLDFLEQYSSVSTPSNYRVEYRDFFELVYGRREPPEDLAGKYFTKGRGGYQKDVRGLFVSLEVCTPKTTRHKLTAVRTLLIEDDVELCDKFWKRIHKTLEQIGI